MQRGGNIGTLAKPISFLGLKIEPGMIQEATFIHPDTGHAKADKLRENGAKIRGRGWNWIKMVLSHILDINFIP